MEAQATRRKIDQPLAAGRGPWAKLRAAIADSAWGSLAGKGLLYVGGFALLAIAGSGRIHCLAAAAPSRAPDAVAAPRSSSSAEPPATIKPAPSAPPSATPDAGDGGAEARGAADAGAAEGGVTPEGKVALNLAAEEDLRRLPGIGATRAKAILALRARLGRFSRVEDLLKVKGLGRRSLARLRPLLSVD